MVTNSPINAPVSTHHGDVSVGAEVVRVSVRDRLPTFRLGSEQVLPLGIFNHSLISVLGLREALERLVGEHAVAWCTKCSCPAPVVQPQERVSEFICGAENTPAETPSNFVVAVPTGAAGDVDLLDLMEMVGANRAVVEQWLYTRDEVKTASGSAVIGVFSAAQSVEVLPCILEWFSRGGVEVELYEFTSRFGKATRFTLIARSAHCPNCRVSLPPFQLESLSLEVCVQCSGRGWRDIPVGRSHTQLLVCPGCDGLGSSLDCSGHRFFDIPLTHITRLSFHELLALADQASAAPEPMKADLRMLVEIGLGSYTIGMPEALLSAGERLRLALTIACLSQCRSLVFDLQNTCVGALGPDEREYQSKLEKFGLRFRYFEEKYASDTRIFFSASDESGFIRDIDEGPLECSSFSFPIGSAAYVAGPVGSGKTFLLETLLPHRFTGRRTYPLRDEFGESRTVHYINSLRAKCDSVADLLGITESISRAFAATLEARKWGCQEQDFLFLNGEATTVSSWRAESVRLGEFSFKEVLSEPVSRICSGVYFDDRCSKVLGEMITDLPSNIALGSPSACVPQELRHWLYTKARLLGILSQVDSREFAGRKRKKHERPLVLLDGCFSLNPARTAELLALIKDICAARGTVIAADKRTDLLSCFACSWRLVPSEKVVRDYTQLETRLATKFTLVRD